MADEITDAIEETVAEAVEEAVEEQIPTVVEAVNDIIDRTVAEITDDSQHSANVDFLAGVAVATAETLTQRVDALEEKIEDVESLAQLADDAAVDALVAATEVQADDSIAEVIESAAEAAPVEIEEDISPPTLSERFSKWWFGHK